MVVLAALIPWVTNIIHLLGIVTIEGLDPTPLAFAVSGVLLAIGILQFQLIDIAPVARSKLVDTMEDIVIVVNPDNLVIDLLPEQKEVTDLGGTMRLGGLPVVVKENTKAYSLYKKKKIRERHRHRFEVNPKYIEKIEKKGLVFSGISEDGKRMEILELPSHKFFMASQFHPEFTSLPWKPNPLFKEFIRTAIERKKKREI